MGDYGRVQVSLPGLMACPDSLTGMNAAVRAVTRMGIYVGAKVFLIYEVSPGEEGLGWGWPVARYYVTCSCREHTVLCPGHPGSSQVAGPGLTEWLLSGGEGTELRCLQNEHTLWGVCPLILSHSH